MSKVFQDYLAANPDSMIYVPAKKKYMVTDSFKPCFLGEVKAGEFVDALITVFGTFNESENKNDRKI
ncbi:hypothetical protein AB4251_10805 [Vibrio lentus]|uniref:hypothetical protein n=1 Tax=Vibrio TaxID=662 RepID=UPI001F530CC4|nr:hypothetical protein [Vibrio lentus]